MAKRKKAKIEEPPLVDPEQPKRQSAHHRPLFVMVTVAAVIGLALLPAELVARRFLPEEPPPGKQENNFRCQPSADPDTTFQLIPNATFLTYGVRFTTNEYGFRDVPVQPKRAGMFRLVCVGDSVTYGTGVSNEQTFPNVLESKLRHRAGNAVQIDVINAGVSAYNIRNVRGQLQTTIDALKPDTVVYTFVENDLDDSLSATSEGLLQEYDPQKPIDSAAIKGSFAPAWIIQREARQGSGGSALGRLFSNWFNRLPDIVPPLLVGDHPETVRRWEWTARELAAMRDLCRSHGARFLVYAFGTRNHSEPVNLKVREICRSLEIPEASTLPLFDHRTYMKVHSLGYDPHCNPAAHVLMADRLQTFLEEQRAIPDVCQRPPQDRPRYDETLDEDLAERLAQESYHAPREIVPAEGEGMLGVLGGIDLEGRMARNCIFRLSGSGNALEVDVTGLFATPSAPQTLSARIEGGEPSAAVNVPAAPTRVTFPVPQEFWNRQIEVELIAGGPSHIPPPEQRARGAAPYTLALHRVARTTIR
ncbi:MAG: hypothetical protein GHCLOJNM_00426 [bacterium]|nr:hypothetical protein [bacterium]